MAAFELNDFTSPSLSGSNSQNQNARGVQLPTPTKVENIISLKIYDCCRQQDCLDFSEMGPARAAETVTLGGVLICEGDVIVPPGEAASVTMDNLHIVRIVIVDKTPSCFRKGFWDVELKYVMEYRIVFRSADANVCGIVKAMSIFNRKVTLFGSEGSELFVSTDLFGSNAMFEAMPFIMAEGKAIPLSAAIIYDYCRRHCHGNDGEPAPLQQGPGTGTPRAVEVSIGLFSIVKLFRLVDLAVESRGFTVPEQCEDIAPVNPCEYFETLAFPMDIFAPPQRPEFLAGLSGDIPVRGRNHHEHDCENCDE